MKTFLTFILVVCFVSVARPCANFAGKGTKYNGEKSSSGVRIRGPIELRSALQRALQTDGEKLEADLRASTNFNDRSDYSVALMYLGRSLEAVALLEQLEKEKPGEYFIAANLGTACELSGNNEEALRWINEGIHRNPASHEGTEWLHAKILEAKIARQKDPAFFEKHSILELTPAQITDSVSIHGRTFSPQQIAEAIQHQLEERLQFVKPPDPAVASLLFDYAAIEAATKSMESARSILSLAADYGYPQVRIQALRKDLDRRLAWRKAKDYFGYAVFGVLGTGILWLLYKRGIFVLSSKDLKRAKPTP